MNLITTIKQWFTKKPFVTTNTTTTTSKNEYCSVKSNQPSQREILLQKWIDRIISHRTVHGQVTWSDVENMLRKERCPGCARRFAKEAYEYVIFKNVTFVITP